MNLSYGPYHLSINRERVMRVYPQGSLERSNKAPIEVGYEATFIFGNGAEVRVNARDETLLVVPCELVHVQGRRIGGLGWWFLPSTCKSQPIRNYSEVRVQTYGTQDEITIRQERRTNFSLRYSEFF